MYTVTKKKNQEEKKTKKNAWCDITAERILETHRLYPNKSLKNKHADKKKTNKLKLLLFLSHGHYSTRVHDDSFAIQKDLTIQLNEQKNNKI